MKPKKMMGGGMARGRGAEMSAGRNAAGLAKAAAMSGRTMPATGRRMNMGGIANAAGRVPTQAAGGMDAAAAGMARRPMGMKKGGSIDGIAKKGKTHTKMVKMK
jgi:hypothetical protein